MLGYRSRAMARRGLLVAFLATALLLGPEVAGADPHRPPHRADPGIVIGIDALGLVEAWWRHNSGPARRSTARVGPAGAELLFHCGPLGALYVWVEEAGFAGARSRPITSFGCAVGEGLFAVDGGGLECRRHGRWSVREAPRSAVIAIDGGPASHLLIGECIGPAGGVAPAFVASGLGAGPCPGGPGTVTFRGRLTAGGC